LRERVADIIPLSKHILQRYCKQLNRTVPAFSDCAERSILEHSWQGNVRELDNVLQRALILQAGQIITAKDLAFETMTATFQNSSSHNQAVTENNLGDDLRGHEQRHILDALERNNCSRRQTAKDLGISERTLRYKISSFREQGIAIPEKVGKNSA
jgi:two-component system response regulator FlrC